MHMRKEHLIESLLNFQAHDLSIQLERDQIGGGTQLHMNSFHFFFQVHHHCTLYTFRTVP